MADEEAEQTGFAAAVLLDLVRVRGKDRSHPLGGRGMRHVGGESVMSITYPPG